MFFGECFTYGKCCAPKTIVELTCLTQKIPDAIFMLKIDLNLQQLKYPFLHLFVWHFINMYS